MDKLVIEPMVGIGTIKLGMNKAEVENCILKYEEKYNVGYLKHLFRVDYDSHQRVFEIEIIGDLKEFFDCEYKGIDLFNTKASELVKVMDKISPYNRDNEDTKNGFVYEFPQLGLSLWRGGVLREEDLNSDWFKKEFSPENQKEELKYLYFETVCIRK